MIVHKVKDGQVVIMQDDETAKRIYNGPHNLQFKNHPQNDGVLVTRNNVVVGSIPLDGLQTKIEAGATTPFVGTVDDLMQFLLDNDFFFLASGGGSGTLSALNVGNTLYVDSVYGDDVTATPDDMSKPYELLATAIQAANSGDTVWCRRGTHLIGVNVGDFLAKDGVTVFLEPQATIEQPFASTVDILSDQGVATNFRIEGNGRLNLLRDTTPFITTVMSHPDSNYSIVCDSLYKQLRFQCTDGKNFYFKARNVVNEHKGFITSRPTVGNRENINFKIEIDNFTDNGIADGDNHFTIRDYGNNSTFDLFLVNFTYATAAFLEGSIQAQGCTDGSIFRIKVLNSEQTDVVSQRSSFMAQFTGRPTYDIDVVHKGAGLMWTYNNTQVGSKSTRNKIKAIFEQSSTLLGVDTFRFKHIDGSGHINLIMYLHPDNGLNAVAGLNIGTSTSAGGVGYIVDAHIIDERVAPPTAPIRVPDAQGLKLRNIHVITTATNSMEKISSGVVLSDVQLVGNFTSNKPIDTVSGGGINIIGIPETINASFV